jgi:plasmid maintenance system antidote protein VapI
MGYLLKKDAALMVKGKYKNSYFAEKLNLSSTYISLIMHRRRPVAKHMAFAFAKAVSSDAEINDLFEQVK